MKKLQEFINEEMMITEHFVNLFKKEEMRKYADEIWPLLQKSYEYCGGIAGMDSPEQLIEETTLWKLVRRTDKITAGVVYNNKRGGRKMCYCFNDGTEQGVKDCKKIMEEDSLIPDRQAWGEFSGKAVSTMFNLGAMPIRADIAKEIMKDKEFDAIKKDGYYYTRKIGGAPHTKLMMGNIRGKIDIPETIRQELKKLAREYDSDPSTDKPLTAQNLHDNK